MMQNANAGHKFIDRPVRIMGFGGVLNRTQPLDYS